MVRFRTFVALTALIVLGCLLATPSRVLAKPPAYSDYLDQALIAMETGRHLRAADSLKNALAIDRNDPSGLLALGTYYLHTGRAAQAAAEFDRLLARHPDDTLARFARALAGLAQGRREAAPFEAIDPEAMPAARSTAAYLHLISGDAAGALKLLGPVGAREPDPLRLQIGAFAALRGKDPDGGEGLLRELLSRPTMQTLAEDPALLFSFETGAPIESGARPERGDLGLPPAAEVLTGRTTLDPGPLPSRVAYVTYATNGGDFNASTNYAPFVVDWNTARLPNGYHTLRITAYDDGGHVVSEVLRPVELRNADAPRNPRLSPAEEGAMRERLLALLTPRPARKAAYFALAERATARGDSADALRQIESVVAIDPLFRNARTSLTKYNLKVEGVQANFWRASTTDKVIALTFDDGPNPTGTPALLDVLAAEKVHATFFVVGIRVEQLPELVKRMDDEGHEVANHTYSHPNMTFLSIPSMERELCRNSVLIRNIIGKRPRFFRPPGGNFNQAVTTAAEAMGMAGGFWTVAATKHEEAASVKALTSYVLSQAKPGAIVLMHNAPRTTIAALPEIIRTLRARGYTFVTLSELARRNGKQAAPLAAKPRGGSYGG